MIKLAISPSIIIEDDITILKKYLKNFGNKGSIVAEKFIFEKFDKKISKILNSNIKKILFNGECTLDEINRITLLSKKHNASFIIGLGGGKAIDTSKAIANKLNIKIITIPTSPATGAAASALSAIYSKNGIASHYIVFDKSPDIVLLDYSIISTAPTRMLCAGMADALAKYYESMAYTKGIAKNIYEQTALDLAIRIHKNIFKFGLIAKNDLDKKIISKELKEIIRINIVMAPLVGGIGGEGCRACASHAVNNSFTHIPYMRKFLHGEIVGFGNLIQLMLEYKNKELKKLSTLYKKLDLPYDFKYFGYKLNNNEFDKIVKYICSPKDTLKNMPRKITKNEIEKILKYLGANPKWQ
jgi:glycerol dehydrogenase